MEAVLEKQQQVARFLSIWLMERLNDFTRKEEPVQQLEATMVVMMNIVAMAMAILLLATLWGYARNACRPRKARYAPPEESEQEEEEEEEPVVTQ